MKNKRPIVVVGDVAFVSLTKGKHAIIDAHDVPLVEGRNWCVLQDRALWYARSRYAVSDEHPSPPQTLYMHRLIVQPPDGMDMDHINHNGLDNRRANLRVCTPSQNAANSRPRKISSSQFRGVHWDKGCRKWVARISRKPERFGTFDSEIEAAEAYDKAALKTYGEFAMLNFPRVQRKVTA